MQKREWEYLYVRLEIQYHKYPTEFVVWVNSKKIAPILLPSYFSDLGSLGWELVTATAPAILYFKRPKE